MFQEYIFQKAQSAYEKKLLLLDREQLEESVHYSNYFRSSGFEVIQYTNDLDFRLLHADKLKDKDCKIAVIAKPGDYIPYDILRQFKCTEISYHTLYPRLNADTIRKNAGSLYQELVCRAYQKSYDSYKSKTATEDFIKRDAYSQENIRQYTTELKRKLIERAKNTQTCHDWFEIANGKANIDVISTEYALEIETSEVNQMFCDWVLQEYGKLTTILDDSSPVLVRGAMEFMKSRSAKFALIVMDGMSEFDWNIISRSFTRIRYHKSSVMAMIPTITSVSRQCLLSGKLPFQLEDPWHQTKEKAEFFRCAQEDLGFRSNQIEYLKGYESTPDIFTKCCAIIVMGIDELVHSQKQGREGMFNDITTMVKKKELVHLTEKLLSQGFDVYISADHGNTPCVGIGKMVGTGIETETRSHRMAVLNQFADKNQKMAKYNLFEFPKKNYLPDDYDYLICNVGESLDPKGAEVMNHGGISLDEVVVPFISIYAEENYAETDRGLFPKY